MLNLNPERSVQKGAVNRYAQRYQYDQSNNVTTITDLMQSSQSVAMSYDGLDRLKTASGFWGAGVFDYDETGNILAKQLGNQKLLYSYDGTTKRLNSVTGGYTFSYDDRSNVIHNGKLGFYYNRANQLINGAGQSYSYDGHGRRVSKSSASATAYSVYNQAGKLLMTDGANGLVRYIYLGNDQIAKVGSSLALEDKPGYTGHVEDKALGLTYMQQRYYDPVIGRFYSNDPVGFTASNPMMFNRYAYANNNPYKYTDPDGRAAFLAALFTPQGMALAATTIAAVGQGIKGTFNAMSEDSSEPDSSDDSGGVVIEDVKQGQVTDRGWTKEEINELAKGEPSGKTVDQRGPSKTDDGQGRNDTASVYGTKEQHVVVNDRTKEVVQVTNKNDPNWAPDSRIKWNEEEK